MTIVGVDEVGRGCWAGPLVAGAVVLSGPIDGLTDSKLLSPKRRAELAAIISDSAASYGLGWVAADVLDSIGLTAAVRLAMQRAVAALDAVLKGKDYEIIIDGSYNFLADHPKARAMVKADLTEAAVSAASILAKVARDSWMVEQAASMYPQYGFDRHVGYGTATHRRALAEFGVTPLHRRSFKPVQAFC